jgi:hypothetical protein
MMSMIASVYFSDLNNSSKKKEEAGEVCIANISPFERQKRLRFGVQQFIFALLVSGVLIGLHLNPLWRLSMLFLFWAAAVGFFQAYDKT